MDGARRERWVGGVTGVYGPLPLEDEALVLVLVLGDEWWCVLPYAEGGLASIGSKYCESKQGLDGRGKAVRRYII